MKNLNYFNINILSFLNFANADDHVEFGAWKVCSAIFKMEKIWMM